MPRGRARPIMLRVPATPGEEQELLAGAARADLGIGEYLRDTGLSRARRDTASVPEPVRALRARVVLLDDLIAELADDVDRVSDALGLPPESEH